MYKGLFITTTAMVITVFSLSFTQIGHNAVNRTSKKQQKTTGIQFIEADFSKALAEAKQQHKLIFLDAYAIWCGPCKLLKKTTFADKAAGEFFNQQFINVAVDMEKGQGPALLKRYGVDAFPTLLITDENGNLLTFTKGYINAADLISFGQHGIDESKKGK